jgi:hypothetical protein
MALEIDCSGLTNRVPGFLKLILEVVAKISLASMPGHSWKSGKVSYI